MSANSTVTIPWFHELFRILHETSKLGHCGMAIASVPALDYAIVTERCLSSRSKWQQAR
jgi:hypothetical protein